MFNNYEEKIVTKEVNCISSHMITFIYNSINTNANQVALKTFNSYFRTSIFNTSEF